MRRRLLVLLLFLGLPLLSVGAATPASAQTASSVDVTSVTLVARGAAVEVTATVTCEAGSTAYLSFVVTQRSGSGIAQGYGYKQIVCTGEPQAVTVLVAAQAGGERFRKGTAVVTTYLAVCNPYDCQTTSLSETLQISR